MGADLEDSRWAGNRNFKTNVGWRVEDITQPDTFVEPFVASLGDYSWRNRIATTYEARRTGENFLPLPGEYTLHPGEISRGGSVPSVVAREEGTAYPLVGGYIGGQRFANVVGRANRAGVSQQGLQYNGIGGKMPGYGQATRSEQ